MKFYLPRRRLAALERRCPSSGHDDRADLGAALDMFAEQIEPGDLAELRGLLLGRLDEDARLMIVGAVLEAMERRFNLGAEEARP